MEAQYITIWDYLLLPFYVLIVFLIAFRFRNKYYPKGHPWRGYFTNGFTIKIIGCLFIGLVYQYYYGGGDTSNYFKQAKIINSSFFESSPITWVKLMLHTPKWYDGQYSYYISQLYWYEAPSEYFTCRITAFINMFTFNTFLPSSIIFASITFTGVWALFRSFVTQYPENTKAIAICVLYIPSVTLWGSSIFKDTVCMGCIGWLTYGVFRMLVIRDVSFRNIFFTIVSFYMIAKIKIYILLAFIPALALWILFNYLYKVKNKFMRFIIRFFVIGFAAGGFLFLTNKFSDSLGKYSLGEVAKTSATTKDWITQAAKMTEGGDQSSTYDLGDFDPSPMGMLKVFPQAVNVTLFRPYPWEVHKVITLLSSLEAFAFILLTLKVLISVGPIKVWRAITADPNIQFCLIFTIVFAFAVGMSAFNFGALSRYRIPCLPFFAMALMLIYYKYNPPERNIFSPFRR